MPSSTYDTVRWAWRREGGGNIYANLSVPTDSSTMQICIPIDKNGIFVPKIIPDGILGILDFNFITQHDGDTLVLNIPNGGDPYRWEYKSIAFAFNKRFSNSALTKCKIANRMFLTIGGGMIIDEQGRLLLICGEDISIYSGRRKAVYIDKIVYTGQTDSQLSTFIKNTLFKYYIGEQAEVQITDLSKMLAHLTLFRLFQLPNVRHMLNSLRSNADKIFYQI